MVFAVGLALVVAESALADDGLLPQVKPPALPPVPTVTAPPLPPVTVPPPPPVTVPPVLEQLPAPLPQQAPPPAPSSGSRSAPSVSRAAPSGSGGRSAPIAAARGGRAAESSAASRAVPRRGGRVAGRGGVKAVAAQREGDVRRVRLRERRLRTAVRRHRACLSGLPTLERRVLVLRSGVGPRAPRTRARVARALDLSGARVRRIERRGLRRLRGLARAGCGAAERAPAAVPPAPAIPASGFGRVALAAATFDGGEPAEPERDEVEVKGEQQSSSGSEPRRAPPKLAPPAAAEPPSAVVNRGRDGSGGSTDLTLPLLVLAAVLGLALAVRHALRSARP